MKGHRDHSALFLAADAPWPPDGGGRIVTLRMLEAFASQFAVDLLALADIDQPGDLSHLRSICRRVELVKQPFTFGRHRRRQLAVALRSLVSSQPYRLRKFSSPTFAARLEDLKRNARYTVIHHDQFGVVPYLDRRYPSTATAHNVESDIYALAARRARGGAQYLWAAVEGRKLKRAESHWYPRFDTVFALSEQDASSLADLGAAESVVVPVPVEARLELPATPPPNPSLITIGSMSWFGVEDGLLWLHREVMPRVRAAIPHAVWHLVGPHAGPRVREIADGTRNVLHGYLPSVEPLLGQTRVCAVPLHVAGGIRIKILEMMGRGVPCVATPVGARGIEFADGDGCFRREGPAAFADALIALLRDDALWMETSRRGWHYVRERHTRRNADARVEQGLQLAVGRAAERGAPRA